MISLFFPYLAAPKITTRETQVPCIAHQDGPDLPLLPAALADPDLTYVVVTSPEAAKVFLAGWTEAGKPSVPVACVGKATGDALRAKGVTPAFTPSKATGETLAAEIPIVPPSAGDGVSGDAAAAGAGVAVGADDGGSTAKEEKRPSRRVLYPASAKAQKTVETGLQARGFEVRRLNTYDTVPATWDETAGSAAAAAAVAAFGSPSAVKTWAARVGVAVATTGAGRAGREDAERNDDAADADADSTGAGGGAGGALAACIGETSARACREAGWPESTIFYPEKPGMEGWAKAVGDALAAVENASSSPSSSSATTTPAATTVA